MKHKFLLLATTLAIHSAALAETKVPSLINYQGYVATSAGVAIGAGSSVNRTVTFRFWKSATDTAAASRLYSETQTVTILNGDFSVLIGSGAAVDGEANSAASVAAVFANKEVFLGITVDDGNTATTDAEVTPRQQLVSTAFAFRASVAESVDDGVISNTMLAPNAVDTTQIAGSAVTAEKIAASAVGSSQVADGSIVTADIATDTILANDIAAGAVGTSEILDGTIATADMANSAVTGAKVATDTLVSGNIAAGAVGTSEIADGSITASDLGAAGITGDETSQLRIVRGSLYATGVAAGNIATGVTKTGTGWSYTYNNTAFRAGLKITFSPPFSATPTITVSNGSVFGRMPYVMRPNASATQPVGVTAPDANGFWYGATFGTDNCSDPLNPGSGGGMEFIAIGPR